MITIESKRTGKTRNKAKRQDWACPREALITDNNVKARQMN